MKDGKQVRETTASPSCQNTLEGRYSPNKNSTKVAAEKSNPKWKERRGGMSPR